MCFIHKKTYFVVSRVRVEFLIMKHSSLREWRVLLSGWAHKCTGLVDTGKGLQLSTSSPPCNLSRYLHAARSPDLHSTFSSCRPTNPLRWLISRQGTLFSFVAYCTNLLSLFAPLPQFHPTSFWGFETALAHQEAGCIVIAIAVVPFRPSNLLRPPRLDSLVTFLRILYLPTTCLWSFVSSHVDLTSVASSFFARASLHKRVPQARVAPRHRIALHFPTSALAVRVGQK